MKSIKCKIMIGTICSYSEYKKCDSIREAKRIVKQLRFNGCNNVLDIIKL